MKYLIPFLIVFSASGHGIDGCLVKCVDDKTGYRIPCGEFKISCKDTPDRSKIKRVTKDLAYLIGSAQTLQEQNTLKLAEKHLKECIR